jgi:hypothetical protein
MEMKQYPITNNELHMAMLLVLVLPHGVQSQDEVFTNLCQEGVMVLELTIHSNHTGRAWSARHKSRWCPAIDHLKRRGPKR